MCCEVKIPLNISPQRWVAVIKDFTSSTEWKLKYCPSDAVAFLSQDFVFGLSIILRGTINDRLNWAFNLYDLNKDGCITKEVKHTHVHIQCAVLWLAWTMCCIGFLAVLFTNENYELMTLGFWWVYVSVLDVGIYLPRSLSFKLNFRIQLQYFRYPLWYILYDHT